MTPTDPARRAGVPRDRMSWRRSYAGGILGRMSGRPGLPVPREAPKAGFEAPQVDDPTLLNLHDYERVARGRLPEQALSYYVSGSMDERALADNRAAFARRRLLPRIMT